MAIQWLSHQTGLAALAGCSGVLEEWIKETKEEGSRRQVKVGVRDVQGTGIRGATDKKRCGREKGKKRCGKSVGSKKHIWDLSATDFLFKQTLLKLQFSTSRYIHIYL